MTWWDSIESVRTFNTWMQALIICFGALTVVASIASLKASRRIDELEDARDAAAADARAEADRAETERLAAAETSTGNLKRELDESRRRQAEAEQRLTNLQEQQRPRRFAPEDQRAFVKVLTDGRTSGKVKIVAPLGDGEALMFANQLKELLVRGGLRPEGVDQVLYSEGVPVGIMLVVRKGESPPAHAAVLQRAFSAVRMKVPGIVNPQTDEEFVALIVGRKP